MKKTIITLLLIAFNLYSQGQESTIPSTEKLTLAVEILQQNFFNKEWNFALGSTNPWGHKNIWNAHNTLEVLLDYAELTEDTNYNEVIELFANSMGAYDDAINAGYDDAQWTGIALIKAFRLTGNKNYLQLAIDCWDYIKNNSWDDQQCSGGLWWNLEKTYKNAITNELFIVFSTLMYFETQEPTYKKWAFKTWDWFESSGFIASKTENSMIQYLANDGLTNACENNGGAIWTYNQAVIIGGLTNLWKISGDDHFLNTALNIANSSIEHLTQNGILVEKPWNKTVCEDLNTDQQQFKGIFARYLSELCLALPEDSYDRIKFTNFLISNSDKLLGLFPELKFEKLWDKKNGSKSFNAITQTAGIDLLIATIKLIK